MNKNYIFLLCADVAAVKNDGAMWQHMRPPCVTNVYMCARVSVRARVCACVCAGVCVNKEKAPS